MKLLDLTLDTPHENLALDEALLETAAAGAPMSELLRLWESPVPMVVLGRSSRMAEEVDLAACRKQAVPVLRRCSGGAAVVAGPGCLMYALVVSYELRPHWHMIAEAHRGVMHVLADALRALAPGVRWAGTCDLMLDGRKFSGNSLRCKRTHLLYHGTLLYGLPLDLLSSCLRQPPREPAYRAGRSHSEFVTNLGVSGSELRQALIRAWQALEPCQEWPRAETEKLVETKYSQPSWNECL